METQQIVPEWTQVLEPDDWAFMLQFMLASGSLKEMARYYRVSYPTVRLRLDRLITKLKVQERFRDETPMERLLRLRYAEGRLDEPLFLEFLATYRKDLEKRREP